MVSWGTGKDRDKHYRTQHNDGDEQSASHAGEEDRQQDGEQQGADPIGSAAVVDHLAFLSIHSRHFPSGVALQDEDPARGIDADHFIAEDHATDGVHWRVARVAQFH